MFFEEMLNMLSQIINKYDNFLIEEDFILDISISNNENTSYFSDLSDTFNLTQTLSKIPYVY